MAVASVFLASDVTKEYGTLSLESACVTLCPLQPSLTVSGQ